MLLKMVNLTPHDITVVADDGSEQTVEYPRSGQVARAVEVRVPGHALSDTMSIGTYRVSYLGVDNLPEPQPGVGFIVSVLTLIAAKASGRDVYDLYYPGQLVRDIKGRTIGCAALYQMD